MTQAHVPVMLEEVLDLARHRALVLIEIKADFITERILQVVETVVAAEHVVLQSFNPAIVERIKLLAPALQQPLVSNLIDSIVAMSFRWGVSDGN